MPLAPPVIKIVLLVSFIINTPKKHYVTAYKVARKFSTARRKHNVFRMHGETARRGGARRPAVREIRGTIVKIVLDLPA